MEEQVQPPPKARVLPALWAGLGRPGGGQSSCREGSGPPAWSLPPRSSITRPDTLLHYFLAQTHQNSSGSTHTQSKGCPEGPRAARAAGICSFKDTGHLVTNVSHTHPALPEPVFLKHRLTRGMENGGKEQEQPQL